MTRGGGAHTALQQRHLDATRTTSLCVSLEMNLFILAAPKDAYAALNCSLFYLMRYSLNYHLSFYSSPLLRNEQSKTFQIVFFCFFNSPDLPMEFASLARDPSSFFRFFFLMYKFLQFVRKRQRSLMILHLMLVICSGSQIQHEEKPHLFAHRLIWKRSIKQRHFELGK